MRWTVIWRHVRSHNEEKGMYLWSGSDGSFYTEQEVLDHVASNSQLNIVAEMAALIDGDHKRVVTHQKWK